MKRILITGKNSYVGNSFEKWLENYPSEYQVDKISLRDESWREQDFSGYDSVLHVAGIVHRKETKENEQLYYQVNRDLAYEVAKKAKNDSVKHFVFLSSMNVYGMDTGVIDGETVPHPKSYYGKSKLQAEELIDSLIEESFKVAIVRPPMIYGEGCKGNYQRLAKLAVKTPAFPDVSNQRSMLFINNLSEFMRLLINASQGGLFFPQNKEYVNTTELVRLISKAQNKKIKTIKSLKVFVRLGLSFSGTFRKVFGTLVYDDKISIVSSDTSTLMEQDYETISFHDSILLTEKEFR